MMSQLNTILSWDDIALKECSFFFLESLGFYHMAVSSIVLILFVCHWAIHHVTAAAFALPITCLCKARFEAAPIYFSSVGVISFAYAVR